NSDRIEGERPLVPRDEIHVGRTHLVFVEDMDELPELPPSQPSEEDAGGMSIKKRLGQTRFLTPPPPGTESSSDTSTGSRHGVSRDLSLLYRLALDMGAAANYEDLCGVVLDTLLEATPAEVGAILSVPARPPASGRRGPAAPELPGTGKSLRGIEL